MVPPYRTGPRQVTAAQRKEDADALIRMVESLPSVEEFRARVHYVHRAIEALHLAPTDARGDREDPHLLAHLICTPLGRITPGSLLERVDPASPAKQRSAA